MIKNMKLSLSRTFTVRYYEVDAGGRLSVENLCNYMQEVAGLHAEALGVGFELLNSRDLTWVLARWQVCIDKLPKAQDEVILETWPSSVERLRCRREFRLSAGNGEILARASSWWVVVNNKTFKLERVPEFIKEIYPESGDYAVADFELRLSQVKDAAVAVCAPVRWSDIDVNDHVNNANYLDWILQSVPRPAEDRCLSRGLRQFEINFKSEARPGDILETRCTEVAGEKTAFAHSVYADGGQREVIRAYSCWEWTREDG